MFLCVASDYLCHWTLEWWLELGQVRIFALCESCDILPGHTVQRQDKLGTRRRGGIDGAHMSSSDILDIDSERGISWLRGLDGHPQHCVHHVDLFS